MEQPRCKKTCGINERHFNIGLILVILLVSLGCMVSSPVVSTVPSSSFNSSRQTRSENPYTSPPVFGIIRSNGDIEIHDWVLKELDARTYNFTKKPTVLIYHTHATEGFTGHDEKSQIVS